MGLPESIRFPLDYSLGQGQFLFFKGAIDDRDDTIKNAFYKAGTPSYSINGVLREPAVTNLMWQAAVAPKEGDTVLADCGWFTVGSRQNKETGLIEPYGYSAPAFVPYTFPEGYNYSQLMFFFELIGVNEMAGTLAKFTYTDDKGTSYVMLMDESNGDAVGNAKVANSSLVTIPGRLRLRYLLAEQTDNPKVKRRIAVGAPGNTNYINGGTITLETVSGSKTFRITGRVGERFSF